MEKIVLKSKNILYPAPAAMVTCLTENDVPNIITISWTGNINSDPVMLSISVRKNRYSYNLIKTKGEFVVNLPSKNLVRAVDFCGTKSGKNINKFKELNLTQVSSSKVKVPSIGECPINIECKLKNIIELGSHDMFLGEVLAVSVNKDLLVKNRLDLKKADLICYSNEQYYSLGEMVDNLGCSSK